MKLSVIGFFGCLYSVIQTTSSLAQMEFPANPIQKPSYYLEFNDEFTDSRIDSNKWLTCYLPQWSSKNKSMAQYDLVNGNLVLKITEQQAPWCPEFNGKVKCSSFQTGVYAGKLGSNIGQHKINPFCIVREEQKELRLYTPKYGYFEIRAKAIASPNNVVAFWLIGFEDSPEKSGEICIMEVKGGNKNGYFCQWIWCASI